MIKHTFLTATAAVAMILGGGAAYAGGPAAGPIITQPPACEDEECETGPVTTPAGDGGTGTGTGGTGTGGTTTPVDTTSAFTASGITLYSTRSAYNAAVASNVTNDFNFVSPSDTNGLGSISYANGTYTDGNGTIFAAPTTGSVVNLNALDSSYISGSNQVGNHFGSDVLTSNYEALTITFAQAVNSFALDYGSLGRAFANQTDTFTFTIPTFGTQTQASNGAGLSFFGLSSETAFNTITISAQKTGSAASNRYFDNVSYSPAAIATAAVPEPATWAMMVGGFGMLGGAMRRSRKSVNALV